MKWGSSSLSLFVFFHLFWASNFLLLLLFVQGYLILNKNAPFGLIYVFLIASKILSSDCLFSVFTVFIVTPRLIFELL